MIRVLGTDNKDKDLYVFGSRVVFILLIGTVMFISSAKSEKFICNELLDRSGQIERVVSGKSYPIVYFTDGSRLELPNWREDTTSSYSSVYDTWSGRVRATTYVKEPLSQGEYEGIILDASERKVIPIKKEPER